MRILFNTVYYKETPKNAQILNCIEIARRLSVTNKFEFAIFNTTSTKLDSIKSIKIDTGVIGKLKQLIYLVFGPEKVVVYYYDGFVDKIFAKFKWIRKKKLIVTIETDHTNSKILKYEPTYKRFQERIDNSIKHADLVVPISEHIKNSFREKLVSKNVEVAHVGFSSNFIFNDNNKKEFISYVGTIQERKQPHLILQISEKYPNEEFVFIGKGEGTYANQFEKLFYNKKVNNVKWYSDLSYEEVSKHLTKTKIFLFPSIYEGTPKVLYEAAGCGVPCIILDKIYSPVVIDSKTGFICENFGLFVEKFDFLLKNEDTRKIMSKNIYEVSKKYSWDYVITEWETIFSSYKN